MSNSKNSIVTVIGIIGICLGAGVARAQETAISREIRTPAERGLVASFDGGVSLPVSTGNQLDMGYHFGGTLGVELRIGGEGSRWSVTPELVGSYTRWNAGGPLGFDAAQSMWTIQPGCKFTYYLGPVGLWAALHTGYGQVAMDLMRTVSISQGGLAFRGSAGAMVMIGRHVGLGPFAEFNATLVGPSRSGSGGGQGELNFGLRLKAKLPL